MLPSERSALSAQIKDRASKIGFHLVGVAPAQVSEERRAFFDWWLSQGFAAGMQFLSRQRERRQSLENILPGAKSVVVCALRFPGVKVKHEAPKVPSGKIARYASGADYHDVLKEKLDELASFLNTLGPSKSLSYVDTGAFSERDLATKAGIGWIGKNAMLIHSEEGSYFWLGEVITTLDLEPDSPHADRCGSCRRCIDACPTSAIVEEKRAVDSTKCLSFWNIEHRGPIPEALHKPMGNWLLGCDICQEVCPWNAHSLKHGRKDVGLPEPEYVALETLLNISKEEFKAQFGSRAVARAKYEGMQRNAQIVLNNLN